MLAFDEYVEHDTAVFVKLKSVISSSPIAAESMDQRRALDSCRSTNRRALDAIRMHKATGRWQVKLLAIYAHEHAAFFEVHLKSRIDMILFAKQLPRNAAL